MASIRNGILGGFNGKVGDVIGQNYAGISTMRAVPKYVSNPKTPAQQYHRKRMALAGSFLSAFNRGLSFSTWNKSSVKNAFNNALRNNLKYFDLDESGKLTTDLFSLKLGEYVGEPLYDAAITLQDLEPDQEYIKATLTWNNKFDSPWMSPNDSIILFAVQEISKGFYKPLYCDVLDKERGDGSADIIIPCGLDVVTGTIIYFTVAVVAQCKTRVGHNPQKPSEVIKIPAKNICKNANASITIPAHNIPAFKSAGSFVKEVKRNNKI